MLLFDVLCELEENVMVQIQDHVVGIIIDAPSPLAAMSNYDVKDLVNLYVTKSGWVGDRIVLVVEKF